jgi:hypothetical protein
MAWNAGGRLWPYHKITENQAYIIRRLVTSSESVATRTLVSELEAYFMPKGETRNTTAVASAVGELVR